MGNSRHIFKFACSEKLPFSGNSKNPEIKEVKKVKLVSEDNTKKIEFHGSYFGSYYIFKPQGESNEKFQLFVHRTRDDDIGEEVYLSDPIDLESIRVQVRLDNQCKYQVALSLGNNEWITLPRSSLSYINYDDLKKYYNKDLSLSQSSGRNYVMHGRDKVCELAFRSIPVCLEFSDSTEKIAVVMPFNGIRTDPGDFRNYRLVIERNNSNELSVYLSDQREVRVRNLEYLNKFLESALLENSNIREVLPELKIDDNVNLDTRQLSCWINNASTVQKIATDEGFKNSVKDLLKSDPEFINSVKGERGPQGLQGRKGEDANPGEVVRKWANDGSKRYMISQEIVKNENFQGAVKYLLKQDSKFKSGVGDVLKSDQDFKNSVRGDPGKDGESPSAGAVATQLLTDSNNKNTLVTEVAKNEDLRKSVAGNQDLRTAVATNLKKDETFQTTVKGDPGQDGESPSAGAVATQLLTDSDNKNMLVTEIAKNGDLQKSIAGNRNLRTAVATNLKKDETFQTTVKGERGERGPQGEQGLQGPQGSEGKPGQDGESPPVDAVAQELITNKVNELGQAVLEAKDDKGKEILVNNPDLQGRK